MQDVIRWRTQTHRCARPPPSSNSSRPRATHGTDRGKPCQHRTIINSIGRKHFRRRIARIRPFDLPQVGPAAGFIITVQFAPDRTRLTVVWSGSGPCSRSSAEPVDENLMHDAGLLGARHPIGTCLAMPSESCRLNPVIRQALPAGAFNLGRAVTIDAFANAVAVRNCCRAHFARPRSPAT